MGCTVRGLKKTISPTLLLASEPGKSPCSALSLPLAGNTFLHSFQGSPPAPPRLSVLSLNPFLPVILYVNLESLPSLLLFLPPLPTLGPSLPYPLLPSGIFLSLPQTFQVLGTILGASGMPDRGCAAEKTNQHHILEIAIKIK